MEGNVEVPSDIIKKDERNVMVFPATEEGLKEAKKMLEELRNKKTNYKPLRFLVDYESMHQLLAIHGMSEEDLINEIIKYSNDIIRKELKAYFEHKAKEKS